MANNVVPAIPEGKILGILYSGILLYLGSSYLNIMKVNSADVGLYISMILIAIALVFQGKNSKLYWEGRELNILKKRMELEGKVVLTKVIRRDIDVNKNAELILSFAVAGFAALSLAFGLYGPFKDMGAQPVMALSLSVLTLVIFLVALRYVWVPWVKRELEKKAF